MTQDKEVKVVRPEDARYLALKGRVIIVGHGEFVSDSGEVVKVALVKWTEATIPNSN